MGVGLLSDQADLGGQSIGHYLPFGESDGGIYGTTGAGNICRSSGVGTCADSGAGGATLSMILRFSIVSVTGPSHLTINFGPSQYALSDPMLESLQVFQGNGKSTVALTDLITGIGPLLTSNGNIETLNLDLGRISTNPLFVELNFATHLNSKWPNSEAFLRATVGSFGSDPAPQPVPGPVIGAGLPGLVLGFGALIELGRRRRQKQNTSERAR